MSVGTLTIPNVCYFVIYNFIWCMYTVYKLFFVYVYNDHETGEKESYIINTPDVKFNFLGYLPVLWIVKPLFLSSKYVTKFVEFYVSIVFLLFLHLSNFKYFYLFEQNCRPLTKNCNAILFVFNIYITPF